MKDIAYHRPATVDEAVKLKDELGPKAVFVAGGTDVMVMHHQKKLAFEALISLRRLEELGGIRVEDGFLLLGPAVTLTQILASPLIQAHVPILRDAAKVMGSTQMRNVATVGGNVMSAAPSGDTLGPLLCLDAVCVLRSAKGERRVPMTEMFAAPRTTAAEPDELLTVLEIPLPHSDEMHSAGHFYKLTRRSALDLALVNMAVQLWLSPGEGRILKARVAAGVAAPTPRRLTECEETLTGAMPDPALLERAAQAMVGQCSLRDSFRCASWYREHVLKVMLVRSAATALARLGVNLDQAA